MKIIDVEDQLFQDELEIIERAAVNIQSEKLKKDDLQDEYEKLLINYKKLLKLTRKIANLNILDVISSGNPQQYELFKEIFDSIFEDKEKADKSLYLQQRPGLIKINDNYISIKYRIINDYEENSSNEQELIMLILTDITEKQKAEDQVLYLSYHDKLTGLYNRAYVDNVTPGLVAPHNLPISIIMGDMNGLKLTNDVFGHSCGDKLLVNLSRVLKGCCRKSDIIARWGGDEFLIILTGTDEEACKKICSNIKKKCTEFEPDPIELSAALGHATMENFSTGLNELFNMAENEMYSNKLLESKIVRRKIITNLENILHTKCFEDKDHIVRIKALLGKFLNLLERRGIPVDTDNLKLLASFHDIGKIGVPREILGKAGSLNENEWKIMQSHIEIGFRMAQSIDEPVLAQGILAMRERWDGKGYPYGLKGEQIPVISRILSIADAFDVMTHDRPYRKSLSQEETIIELKRCSGSQFDPSLVESFLEILR